MKRFVIFTAVSLVIAFILIFGVLTVRSAARSTAADRPRLYKSIEISAGDTLWEIAERYAPDFDMNVRDYLSELKQVNGITSDRIIAGRHLIVICADTAEN